MRNANHELKFLELVRQKHFTVFENGDIYRTLCRLCKSECFIKVIYLVDKCGYYRMRFTYNRKQYIVLVHRVVYMFFRGEIPDGMQINHKDGNKGNNALSNLEMVTPRENLFHARYVTKTNKCYGVTHHSARLKPADIARIMYYHHYRIYTTKHLAVKFGVSSTHILDICKLKVWRCLFE